MLLRSNGQWLVLAGNDDDGPAIKSHNGYLYRLAGIVTGGRIVPRWGLIAPGR